MKFVARSLHSLHIMAQQADIFGINQHYDVAKQTSIGSLSLLLRV
jgi:hypothetical protein